MGNAEDGETYNKLDALTLGRLGSGLDRIGVLQKRVSTKARKIRVRSQSVSKIYHILSDRQRVFILLLSRVSIEGRTTMQTQMQNRLR